MAQDRQTRHSRKLGGSSPLSLLRRPSVQERLEMSGQLYCRQTRQKSHLVPRRILSPETWASPSTAYLILQPTRHSAQSAQYRLLVPLLPAQKPDDSVFQCRCEGHPSAVNDHIPFECPIWNLSSPPSQKSQTRPPFPLRHPCLRTTPRCTSMLPVCGRA